MDKKLVEIMQVICFFSFKFATLKLPSADISGAGNTKILDLQAGFNIKVFLRFSEKLRAAEIRIYLLKF